MIIALKCVLLIHASILLQIAHPKETGPGICNSKLGLEFGSSALPNLSFGSSVSNSASAAGRLNNPDAAWCFGEGSLDAGEVYFSVDLGRTVLVTGFMTQGPPSSLVKTYTHHIPFVIKYAHEENQWNQLSENNVELNSYADSKEADKIERHIWNKAVLARYVRLGVDKDNTIIISKQGCLRFELIGCSTELTPNTTLRTKGSAEGKVVVSWDHPTVWTGKVWAPLHPDTQFVLSYNDVAGKTVVVNAEKKWQAVVSTPVFGASYTFQLECLVPGMQLDCHNFTTALYPSCPSNWIQSQHLCFHSDGLQDKWPEAQKKCSERLQNPFRVESSSSIQNSSSVWLWTDNCLESEQNCCVNGFNLGNVNFKKEKCPPEETKQQVCLIDKKVRFCKINKIVVRETSQSSVDITWTDDDPGWHSIARSFYVTKGRQQDWMTSKEGQVEYEWMTSSRVLSVPDLELNSLYSVLIVPEPQAGHTWLNAHTNEFHLLATGGVVSVNLDILIQWQGVIEVQWEEAKSVANDNKTVAAAGYTLHYSKTLESELGNSTLQTETKFDMQFPQFGDEYHLVLFCHFEPQVVIECGHGELNSALVKYKHVRKESSWIVYIYNPAAKSWQAAEKSCIDQGGHLTSILDADEYQLIKDLATDKKPFWIGGNNCGGKALKTWVDGVRWQFAARMTSFKDDNCCLRVAHIAGTGFVWEGRICHDQLAYVCKFQVQSFTAPVTDLQTTITSPSAVLITWKRPTNQWKPSHYTVEKCTKDGSCDLVTRVSILSSALATGLLSGTTYTFRVATVLDQIGANNTATIEATTDERKVAFKLTKEGVATIEWTAKTKDGKGNEEIKVKFHPIDEPKLEVTVEGKAQETVITGFRFNRTYKLTITPKNGAGEEVLQVSSLPQCDGGAFLNGECYEVSSEAVSWQENEDFCQKKGEKLLDGTKLESQLSISTVSSRENKEFWYKSGLEDGTTCYKAVPHTQDPIQTNCSEKLSAICPKMVVEPLLLSVQNLRASQATSNTFTIMWDPPKSWLVDDYSVTRRENNLQVNQKTTEFVAGDLQPKTTYTVVVIPMAKTTNGQMKGPPQEVQFTLTEETETTTQKLVKKPRGLPDTKESKEDETNQVIIKNNTVPDKLRTFHIIGCSTLIALVFAAYLIFLLCGMYSYRDVIAQIGFEISILVVHIFFLVWALDTSVVDCRSMAICVHFFFTSAFSFLLMEALSIAKAVTRLIAVNLFPKWWHLFVFGWIPPLITIGASAGIIWDDYPKIYPCWLRTTNENLLYASVIPIGLLGSACFLLLLACVCCRPTSAYEVDEQSFTRERVMRMTRWVIFVLLLLTTISWVCGLLGMQNADEDYLLIFIIANILTGVCVLVLRCFGDAEVRQRLCALCKPEKVHPTDGEDESEETTPYHKRPPNIETIDLSPADTDKTKLTGQPLPWDRYVFRP